MKVNRLAVIVSNKKGDCYQVVLSEAEETAVGQFIANLHEGEIKVLKRRVYDWHILFVSVGCGIDNGYHGGSFRRVLREVRYGNLEEVRDL